MALTTLVGDRSIVTKRTYTHTASGQDMHSTQPVSEPTMPNTTILLPDVLS